MQSPEILQVLGREHANIAALLRILEREVAEFEQGGRPDYELIRAVVDYFLSFPDLYHHPKEDLVFARVRQRDPAAVAAMGDLRREHEKLAARTRELSDGVRAILDEAQVPRDAFVRWARDFIDLQKDHMRMEDEQFFPLARALLDAEDWAALKAEMTDAEDPLFGEQVGGRFERLRQRILKWQAEG